MPDPLGYINGGGDKHTHTMSRIGKVLSYAMELCNASERGGRISIRDETRGSLLDCGCWMDKYSQAILSRYPGCSITIVSAQDISTTGFSVFFSLGGCGDGSEGKGSFLPMSRVVSLVGSIAMLVDMTLLLRSM